MSENKKFLKEELNEKDLSKVHGCFIVQVDPKDLRALNINLKPYLVVHKDSKEIVGSYYSLEEAKLSDYRMPYSIINKDEAQRRIFTNNEGAYVYIAR